MNGPDEGCPQWKNAARLLSSMAAVSPDPESTSDIILKRDFAPSGASEKRTASFKAIAALSAGVASGASALVCFPRQGQAQEMLAPEDWVRWQVSGDDSTEPHDEVRVNGHDERFFRAKGRPNKGGQVSFFCPETNPSIINVQPSSASNYITIGVPNPRQEGKHTFGYTFSEQPIQGVVECNLPGNDVVLLPFLLEPSSTPWRPMPPPDLPRGVSPWGIEAGYRADNSTQGFHGGIFFRSREGEFAAFGGSLSGYFGEATGNRTIENGNGTLETNDGGRTVLEPQFNWVPTIPLEVLKGVRIGALVALGPAIIFEGGSRGSDGSRVPGKTYGGVSAVLGARIQYDRFGANAGWHPVKVIGNYPGGSLLGGGQILLDINF